MATLRKGKCYSHVTRPYTRKSKVKALAYIKTIPPSKLVRYDMGDSKKSFDYEVFLVVKENGQIRHNALESARQVVNRRLQNELGQKGYYFKLFLYPHHILRENKMLSGAHADRLQTGMAHSFGRTVGLAVQAKKGKKLFSVKVASAGIEQAKKALRLAYPRMPGTFTINVTKLN
ncbi:50S ribosomal protein L16 [Candidatus Woesearchaeota archaeon]|nr:50S ribosomal protein L16 [Candidatus Woesearchaeota archaeon]